MAHDTERRRQCREMFMKGASCKDIAKAFGMAENTILAWKDADNWVAQRSAFCISRTELRNKILVCIESEVGRFKEGKSDAAIGDTLVKLTTAVKNLDEGISIVDIIEVFTHFTHWLEDMSVHDPALTVDFRKLVNIYLDSYVKFKTQA